MLKLGQKHLVKEKKYSLTGWTHRIPGQLWMLQIKRNFYRKYRFNPTPFAINGYTLANIGRTNAVTTMKYFYCSSTHTNKTGLDLNDGAVKMSLRSFMKSKNHKSLLEEAMVGLETVLMSNFDVVKLCNF